MHSSRQVDSLQISPRAQKRSVAKDLPDYHDDPNSYFKCLATKDKYQCWYYNSDSSKTNLANLFLQSQVSKPVLSKSGNKSFQVSSNNNSHKPFTVYDGVVCANLKAPDIATIKAMMLTVIGQPYPPKATPPEIYIYKLPVSNMACRLLAQAASEIGVHLHVDGKVIGERLNKDIEKNNMLVKDTYERCKNLAAAPRPASMDLAI